MAVEILLESTACEVNRDGCSQRNPASNRFFIIAKIIGTMDPILLRSLSPWRTVRSCRGTGSSDKIASRREETDHRGLSPSLSSWHRRLHPHEVIVGRSALPSHVGGGGAPGPVQIAARELHRGSPSKLSGCEHHGVLFAINSNSGAVMSGLLPVISCPVQHERVYISHDECSLGRDFTKR